MKPPTPSVYAANVPSVRSDTDWGQPTSYMPRTTTTYLGPVAIKDGFTQWERLPRELQAMQTRVVYLSPDSQLFNLAGPYEGREAVSLQEHFAGEYHWPFELVLSEGAYQLGATVERVNVGKRLINFGVTIGGHRPPLTNYQYRMAEEHWWAGQDENRDGYLGIYTRFGGWRWIPVRPERTVDTSLKQDPVAFGNNTANWDVYWLACRPYYSKPALWETWSAQDALRNGGGDGKGGAGGVITLANRGDLTTYVQYLITGNGIATVQDNQSTRQVELPETLESNDGFILVDTDPTQRTITASKDPVDNLFYKIIRSSKILDFFLKDLEQEGIPVWQRFQKRFIFACPSRSVTQFRVHHTDPEGTITAVLPQRYKRSR